VDLEPQLNLSIGVWPAEDGGWLMLLPRESLPAAALLAGVEVEVERLREEAWHEEKKAVDRQRLRIAAAAEP
jgi:hypothetical protein